MEVTYLLGLAAKHPEFFGVSVLAVLCIIIMQLRGIRSDLSNMVTRPECELHRKLITQTAKNMIYEQEGKK